MFVPGWTGTSDLVKLKPSSLGDAHPRRTAVDPSLVVRHEAGERRWRSCLGLRRPRVAVQGRLHRRRKPLRRVHAGGVAGRRALASSTGPARLMTARASSTTRSGRSGRSRSRLRSQDWDGSALTRMIGRSIYRLQQKAYRPRSLRTPSAGWPRQTIGPRVLAPATPVLAARPTCRGTLF